MHTNEQGFLFKWNIQVAETLLKDFCIVIIFKVLQSYLAKMPILVYWTSKSFTGHPMTSKEMDQYLI